MRMLPKWVAAGAIAALAPLAGLSAEKPAAEEPRKIGLLEKAGAHLVQVDLTVRGPREAASRIQADDVQIKVAGKQIERFQLDSLCEAESRPASFLIYFDQRHLTPVGRRRALRTARDMVPRLIVNGNRGMVVSSAEKLRVFANLTSEVEAILEALGEVEVDPEQNDSTAAREDQLVAELKNRLERARSEQARTGKGGNFGSSAAG